MDFLDIRTLLTSYIVSLAICSSVMGVLWRKAPRRSAATGRWFAGFVMQFVAVLLIVLRGVIPDAASIVLSGIFAIGGALLLYTGLEHYLAQRSAQGHNRVLLLVFAGAQTYFTFVAPNLHARSLNYSLCLFLVFAQCAWLMLHRLPPARRDGTTLVGSVMVLACMTWLSRIGFELVTGPAHDYMHAGTFEAVMVLCYEFLALALTFSLVLMVNRQLQAALAADIELRKASEDAVRRSESRLNRAELTGMTGNWELHLDSQTIVASRGAASVYGLQEDCVSYARVKGAALPEYRAQLDAAMTQLIQQGGQYQMEFKIRAADSGEIKDIRSTATYDAASHTVFGVLQDVTAQKQAERELIRLAQTDALTGLANRRHFMQLAEMELARSIRYGRPLSLLMMDLDHFKSINDTHGHQTGDQVLCTVGTLCGDSFRKEDVVGRMGGEEFAVILPETTLDMALEVAERLRQRLADTAIHLPQGLPMHCTLSIGVTSLVDPQTNLDTLISQADRALYEAKHQGRNRVCTAQAAIARGAMLPHGG